MTEATVVIKGRNDLSYAVKQAETSLRGLLKQGELIKKTFTGGAIIGAALAFERLAENAQKAAEKIGDRGTAKALGQLNKAIDDLKSKGLNVIGRVLGDTYIAAVGSDVQKLEVRVRNLREQLELLNRPRGGRAGFELGAMSAPAIEAQLRQAQADLAAARRADPNGANAPLGSFARTRALSRGGGSGQLVVTGAPKAGGKSDPMSGLGDVNVFARPIFDLANEQAKAFEQLSKDVNEDVRANMQDVANETTRMLGDMTIEWEAATSQWTEFSRQAAANMQDAFAEFLFDPFKDGLDGLLRNFADTIRRMVAELIAAQALREFFGWAAGATTGSVSTFFGDLAGKRAAGGPVSAGAAYLVGERGPELFVPRASGTVMPNGAGGSLNVTYNVDARGATTDMAKALPGILAENNRRLVETLRDARSRGVAV